MRGRRSIAVAGVAVVLVVGVAGCSSGPPPQPTPTGTVAAKGHTDLTLTGAVTGTATAAQAVWPVYTAASWDSDSGAPQWSTQCVVDAGGGQWSATVAFTAAGNTWSLGFTHGGNPAPGRHAVEVGPEANLPAAVVAMDLESQKPIADYLTSAGADQYAYYVPTDRAAGWVTIDAGDRSGAVDAWFTPDRPSSLEFHVVGAWACD